MALLKKSAITITRTVITSADGEPVQKTTSIILNGMREVDRVPAGKVYEIFGEQGLNQKARYCVGLEVGDPKILPDDKVQYTTANGETVDLVVKIVEPSDNPIRNIDRDCWCESLNN